MIRFVTGNLFESDAFALVNTVNCEGFMGKGIAYQFKMRYPEMNDEYVKKCKSSKLKPGVLHIFLTGSKLIINFPTKNKWREKSKMEYISAGLDELVKLMTDRNIKSIAIPPLGCGNGGLNWCDVKTLIIQKWVALMIVFPFLFLNPQKIISQFLRTNHNFHSPP